MHGRPPFFALTLVLALAVPALAVAAANDAPANAKAKPAPARRLEDIHIEGEIPVPQVLFVTGRDQRRFLDFQHRRYVAAGADAARAAATPTWIRIADSRPANARKESAP